ncbi:MAG: discoidin domain-containing protein [Planctomycetaceae bacterium]|nr:discoidin domain-containing protein [Planctomycetaceae bacterium]
MNRAVSRALVFFLLAALGAPTLAVYGVQSALAYLGPDGRLVYGTYANENETNADNKLPNFSLCGYMGGGAAIPDVPTVLTIRPQEGDDTQGIQDAIDAVSGRSPNANGFRGAVLLKAGRYQVASTLHIRVSGVVLRGEGQDALGTILEAVTPSDYDVIVLGSGSGSYGAQSGTTRAITSAYVPGGAVGFDVSDASGYAAGDWISVQRTPNQFWIDDLAMGQWGWTPGGYVTDHERYVTAVFGNTITVDVPLVDIYQDKYGGGQIFKLNSISRVNKSGVENLRVESCYASATDELHPWDAIRVQYAENCWVRSVTAKYFAYSCVNLGSYARYVTVEDCAFVDPKSVITGGRRYSFNIESTATRNLFQRCYSHESRHDFVLGSRTRGPNAFVDCYADRSHADAGPHHRWSTGCLFDNVYSSNSIDVENRESSGSGHGWSGAQIVFWNCQTPSQVCDAPKGAMNFAIGSKASKREGHWAAEEPFGWWEHQNADVSPRSLYFQQLQDRLGQAAVDKVTMPAQRAGSIWSQLLAWAGKGAFQPNPLRDNTPRDRPLEIGSPVIFEVLAAADSAIVKYEWYEIKGSSYVPIGENSPLLVLPAGQESDLGRVFFCRVVTNKGPSWSPPARIISNADGGQLAEDFEGRTEDVTIDNLNANGVLGGVWDTEGDSTGNVSSQSVDGSMTLLVSGHSSGTLNRGAGITGLTNPIENAETGVLFFRFKVGAAAKPLRNYLGMHHYSGSAFLNGSTCQGSALTAGFGISADASGTVFDIVTTDHAVTLKTGLVRGQWYNAWIVANNAADTFDVYVNAAAGPGTGVGLPLDSDRITPAAGCAFGVATTSPLIGVMFLVPRAPGDTPLDGMWVDDINWSGDGGLTGGESLLPAAPGNLTAAAGEGMVLLDWDDHAEPDLAQYVVYRSTTQGSGYMRIAEGLSESSYADADGLDLQTRYYYLIRVENTAGHLSGFSNEVSCIPQVTPQIPTGLRAAGDDGSVRLLWDSNTQPDFDFFTVYRSHRADSDFVLIAEGLTNSEYVDETVQNNRAYYYALTETNDEGVESALCMPVEVVPHLPLNIALNKPATASSYYGTAVPSYAVDGAILDYPYIWHSVQDGSDPEPWIRIDLQETYSIDKIRIYNRANSGTYSRNRDFDLDVLDDGGALVWSNYDEATGQGERINEDNWMNSPAMIEYVLPESIAGRYIVLTKRSGLAGASATANIAEFEVYRSFESPSSADLDASGSVDIIDFTILSRQWLSGGNTVPTADIAPAGGDGWVDLADLIVLAEQWLQTD